MSRPAYQEWEPAVPPHKGRDGERRSDDIAELFDTEIRRRMGEVIARAALSSAKPDR
jgi:hypothetical protein